MQSTQLQQRIITDAIDDARLAANQFQLHFQPCDVLALVHRVVGSRAQVDSGHVLQLKIPSLPQTVFVLADAERIARVLTTYLENALAFSPAGQPVTVGMRVEEGITRVWVHNEGAGIPFEGIVNLRNSLDEFSPPNLHLRS